MVAGLLRMWGSIALDQFWPTGRSDTDTTEILLTVSPGAIEFRKNSSTPFHSTHVFDHAIVKGRTRKPPINNGQVTVRLQGIDATELHYQPSPLSPTEKNGLSPAKRLAYHSVTHSYRQYLGATATKALHDFVATAGRPALDCHVFTKVDEPGEAFDTYGRLVGDIEATIGGKLINLNQWLVDQGWAFPAFYSSMTNDEISTLLGLATSARSKKSGVWKYLSKSIGPFDFNLLEPKKNDLTILAADKGAVIFPKLYRRYANWSARKKANVTSQNFQKFLEAGSNGKPDVCFVTADFLANGVHSATHRTFDQFVVAGKTIKFPPDGLVFSEAPSALIGADKKPITHF
jgi:endonuclease YncB( thermonuclease family)